MCTLRIFAVGLVILLFFPCVGSAAPVIKVLPTVQSVEKGGVFQIRVDISTNEAMKDISINPIVPDGFVLDPMKMPGITIDKDAASIHIDHLAAGSALTVSFKAWPPDLTGKPKRGEKEAFYSTRGEPINFIFNVSYYDIKGDITKSQTASTSIRYTTAIGFYLLFGMLGIIIGHVVKIGAQNRKEISSAMESSKSATNIRTRHKIKIASAYIFGYQLTSLITLLAVGFGGLLVLAKDTIPATGWQQAMALGIGLAILTDEQLLTKIKS